MPLRSEQLELVRQAALVGLLQICSESLLIRIIFKKNRILKYEDIN